MKSTVNTHKKQTPLHTAVVYKAVLQAAKLQLKASQVKTRHHAHELTSPEDGQLLTQQVTTHICGSNGTLHFYKAQHLIPTSFSALIQ